MAIGVRGKLFLVSLGLLGVAVATGGVFLEVRLRLLLEAQIEQEIARHAASGCLLSEQAVAGAEVALLDSLADRLGSVVGARITMIDASGQVLGDSELSVEQVERIENHAHRPEIAAAREGQPGSSRRYSTTLDTDMLYVAVVCPGESAVRVVRAAETLAVVDQATAHLRWFLLLAGVLALGAAALLSGLASHLYARTLRTLVNQASALAEGRGKKIPISRADEIGGLIGSLNQMAGSLQQVVGILAAERDRFEAVLEAMTDGVLALDASGRISHANRAATALLRLAAEPVGRILAETIRAPALHEMLATVAPGQPATAEFDLPGSPTRRMRACGTHLRAGAGLVVVLRDVTELRRLETVRQDFVANVSHELRTPVSVIRANAETLLDGAITDPERARQFVEALHRSSERLSALIADLLDISRIDSGEMHIDLQPLALAPLVQAAIENLSAAAGQKGLDLAANVPVEIEARVDERAMTQVLVNLLDNAVKYTPAGGHVEVRCTTAADGVRIEVRDDGPGIEARLRERIFERFYRVDRGRTREMGGTGLGLSIVKNLVEAMGGRVGVEPNDPRGSVFWILLPKP